MKQFNLEKALAGEPVVTRNGKKVTQLTLLDVKSKYSLIGVIDESFETFTDEGVYDVDRVATDTDLFMETKVIKGYVNVYEHVSDNRLVTSYVYESMDIAKQNISVMSQYTYLKTIEITNEI
jgi:hypothetical protein